VGQPRNNLVMNGSYEKGDFTFTLRGQRFGAVTGRQATAAAGARQVPDLPRSPKFITDVSASYKLFKRTQVTMGADNVFDVYPDRITDLGDVATGYSGQGTFGVYRFSGLSPFGFNGRFLYVRMAYSL
jgi:iron complex outermembrane receptor protein